MGAGSQMAGGKGVRQAAPDLIICGLLCVFGGYILLQSPSYGLFGANGRLGPGFLPFVAAAALLVFTIWSAVESVRRSAAEATEAPVDRPVEADGRAAGDRAPASGRRVAVIFGLAVLATLLTTVVGYVLAFGLMTFLVLAFVERKPLWLSALVAGASVLVGWGLFVYLLGVPLPGGYLQLLGNG